ncbi:pyridoxal phosphate-dependent aminotransferase [Thiohalomonas denitrificans]|uniref:Aspartate/methionine/tyrosine aminotransferase n=1 Tax=Thiohalomonas denitrificans TaxID=415747 RepID=A0A1G5PIL2_9GAMM|nr:pyridoxal phosphate-dependent aminotransferase [Thiohalomonas denitrificans]SCZ49337.1 Aspartate/methionine/tyrosine aminotransferase [Thiohalomonas denitrificans]
MSPERPTHTARRMADIEPFHVMELLGRARELEAAGHDIVHMEIGEPDFGTPEPIIERARQALTDGHTHYTPALGLPALREAIAGHYRDRYGVEIDPGRVVITPGASGALLLALGVLLDRDDELLLADPGYPCNRHFARFVEGQARGVPVDATTRYQLDAERLSAHWNERCVAALVASPSNPTGTLLERSELAALAESVRVRSGRLIVDEIYHGLTYGIEAETVLAVDHGAFVVNSFSKYFCMTGWRLGWLVAPEEYQREVEKLMQNLFIAAPTLAQHAALAAFEPETRKILESRRAEFERRRDFLLPALRELGFEIPVEPRGAFYLYADCSRFGDSKQLASDLLEKAGVAVTPGLDFGNYRPEQHLRFAYTTSMERLEEGVRRIAGFLRVDNH